MYQPNGTWLRSFGQFECHRSVYGIAISDRDEIFATDNYSIHVFDKDGALLRKIGSAYGSHDYYLPGRGPAEFNNAMFVPVANLLYVCDRDNKRVQVLTADGAFVGEFGQFKWLYHLCLDNAGHILLSDMCTDPVQVWRVQ